MASPCITAHGGQRILDLVQHRAVGHVIAYKLDRLLQDCADCLTVTAAWDKKGIALHLVDLGGQTLDTSYRLWAASFWQVIGRAAELERNLIRERTSEAMGYMRSRDTRPVGMCPMAPSWRPIVRPWEPIRKSRPARGNPECPPARLFAASGCGRARAARLYRPQGHTAHTPASATHHGASPDCMIPYDAV